MHTRRSMQPSWPLCQRRGQGAIDHMLFLQGFPGSSLAPKRSKQHFELSRVDQRSDHTLLRSTGLISRRQVWNCCYVLTLCDLSRLFIDCVLVRTYCAIPPENKDACVEQFMTCGMHGASKHWLNHQRMTPHSPRQWGLGRWGHRPKRGCWYEHRK